MTRVPTCTSNTTSKLKYNKDDQLRLVLEQQEEVKLKLTRKVQVLVDKLMMFFALRFLWNVVDVKNSSGDNKGGH